MLEKGCRVAMGIDDRRSTRMTTRCANCGWGTCCTAGPASPTPRVVRSCCNGAVAHGRWAVSNSDDGGVIDAGAPADLLLLDWAAIDDDRLCHDIDVLDLVLTRATARHIRQLIVGGRTVVNDGKVLGVDLPAARAEVMAQVRAGLADSAPLAAAMRSLDGAIAAHFEPDSCC